MLKENGIKVDDHSDEGDDRKQLNGHMLNNCDFSMKSGQERTDMPEVILEISTLR